MQKLIEPENAKHQDRITCSMSNGTAWAEGITGYREPEFVLETQKECKISRVGGKAFNISKMTRRGIPVPPGFCITTNAYSYFMDFNYISEEDESISDKIREGLMPPCLVEIIMGAHRKYLNGKPCAVRSSSPFEDSKSASFAGQYKSFLNVKDEALLDAVKECWASLWSKSAVEYRKKMGISKKIKMAVLVQEMVPAEASGVVFTEDDIIIEAVWGLGDILVGGKVTADRFLVERKGSTVVERTISHKHVMSQMTPDGGVEEVNVPEYLRDHPVLDDDHIRKLCALCKKVEDIFGCPQDIEWALHTSHIIFLQARPVTVKQTPTIWSRANIAETQPGYVTYLSRIPENRPDFFVLGVVPLLKRFGIKELPENIKFLEYIYGHMYANITNLHNIIGSIPGLPPSVIDQSIGFTPEGRIQKTELGILTVLRMLPRISRVIYFILKLPEMAEKVILNSFDFIRDIRHRNLEELTLEELDDLVWKMYDRNQEVFQVHANTMLANMLLFGIFQKILRRLGEEDTEKQLITGLEGMSSFYLGVEIWKLAQSASTLPRVSALLLSRRERILEELNQFSEGKEFLKTLDNFMEKCGDRCSQEMELSVPRWEENPSFVLSMVATYLSAQPSNPAETMETQKKVRLETTNRILKNSKNPVEKLIFRKVLEKTQKYLVTRENLKTAWVRGISVMRVLYLAIASKLVDGGMLESAEDIFYLKMTEVSDIIAGNLKKEQINFIEERQKEKEECEHLDVPMVISGKPPPLEELTYKVIPRRILEGLGCSHGVVTGKARVILTPQECSEFAEGGILVAPVTDPGWSPLFVTAGGLVMELGGTLSHGVIIAREYGIPAVVGVKNATKVIKTGQVITVDGNKGLVYIRE